MVSYHFCIVLILQNPQESRRQVDPLRYHGLNENLQGQPYALSSFYQSMRIIIKDCILVFNHKDIFEATLK